ncbi:MAG: 50S ribosomal protein L31 [bacterium]|nr:50S ribosomal protein L31 [bacterium]
MKQGVHPRYYPNAKVICGCGNTFTTGSTRESIRVEICAKCHPYYTGKQSLIDTAGRVERFTARRTKAAAAPKTAKKQRVKKQK